MSDGKKVDFKKIVRPEQKIDKENKLKIANFEFIYKYECFSVLRIGLMSIDLYSDVEMLREHTGYIFEEMNDNCTLLNYLKQDILNSYLNQGKYLKQGKNQKIHMSKEIYWSFSDKSPSTIIDFLLIHLKANF